MVESNAHSLPEMREVPGSKFLLQSCSLSLQRRLKDETPLYQPSRTPQRLAAKGQTKERCFGHQDYLPKKRRTIVEYEQEFESFFWIVWAGWGERPARMQER